MARMINQICEYGPRNTFLLAELHAILEKEPDRRVLILSDRRAHLQQLAGMLDAAPPGRFKPYGFYQGGLKQEQLKQSEQCDIIFGTFQFVSEGFDVPGLDTLILASPKSDIEQAVGRIQRQRPEERRHAPLVLDIVDTFSMFQSQAKKRRAFYKSKKYEIMCDGGEASCRPSHAQLASHFHGQAQFIDDSEC